MTQSFPVTPGDHRYNFYQYRTREFRDKLQRTGFAETRVGPDRLTPVKRGWLRVEARSVASELTAANGRTLIALCRKPT